jgi:hypothetical protein
MASKPEKTKVQTTAISPEKKLSYRNYVNQEEKKESQHFSFGLMEHQGLLSSASQAKHEQPAVSANDAYMHMVKAHTSGKGRSNNVDLSPDYSYSDQ